jgi:hypothetical protein
MLNKAIVACFLATSAIAFGIAAARAEYADREEAFCAQSHAGVTGEPVPRLVPNTVSE